MSEASSYSHRCLVFCRDVYRRNGASPLLLFKIKQSAELIYGSLFDQSSKYSRYEDLKCLWGKSSGRMRSSTVSSVDSSCNVSIDGQEERRSMNIQIRAGIDIVHPKTRHASQGHGMLIRMYPSWGLGLLQRRHDHTGSGDFIWRNPVWHLQA